MMLQIWVSVAGEPVTDDRPEEFFKALAENIITEHKLSRASIVFDVEWELVDD